jgi:uncharacterized lipoprotein YmbA
MRKNVKGLFGAVIFLLAACASPDPVLYTLMPKGGMARPAPGLRIELAHIGLPRYLDRPGIVLAAPSYRVEVAAGARWAEPFDAMLARVLAEDLRMRLKGAEVFTVESPLTAGGASRIEVDITRFEGDGAGRVVLEAVAGVARPGRDVEILTVNLSEPLASRETAAEVAAMSTLLAELADRIAARLP